MKLISLSVTNFRSITQAYKIPFFEITALIGKNNEGKSNMLKALNICMGILDYHAKQKVRYGIGVGYRNNDNFYKWERDFPISLQNSRIVNSIFRLEFKLDSTDLSEFKAEIGSNLNGNLPIEIKIGRDQIPKIKVVKKGKGAKTLNQKSKKIAEYIGKKIQFTYIPAIRTDKESLNVVEKMLYKELETIEDEPKYIDALKTIRELQQPIIDRISITIKDALKDFLPNIKKVSIELQEERRRIGYRQQYDIFIDDGTKTNLEFKGDGVKSLSALGLLKNVSDSSSAFSMIAIEEPESHLHPGAIHLLKDTVYELAKNNQVIISTHNPLFINRQNIKSNIIIDGGKAKASKSIKELRELIGVKASDNLVNANFVLIVEGEEDVVALKTILPFFSPKIDKALKSNFMVIEKIGGASNLSYKLTLLSNALCFFHVLLDNDKAGIAAYQKAEKENSLKLKDLTLVNCIGMPESEFEDCLNKEIYESEILDEYGVDINVSEFRGNKKWSDRVKSVFEKQGKPWNDTIEAKVKNTVAESIKKDVANALNLHKKDSILTLIKNIEKCIDNKNNHR